MQLNCGAFLDRLKALLLASLIYATHTNGHENVQGRDGPDGPADRAQAGTKDRSLRDLLFPQNDWLSEAWESHPLLLSTAHTDVAIKDGTQSCEWDEGKDDAIPTVHLSPGDDHRIQAMQRLFRPDDLETLCARLAKRHSDFTLTKTALRGGEQTTDSFSAEARQTATARDLTRAVERDGYSLVVAYMQRLWEPLALHHDPWGRIYLDDSNLFVTPAAAAVPPRSSSDDDEEQVDDQRGRALATHCDYIDVFVVQLHGQKLWSVAKKPIHGVSPFFDEQRSIKEAIDSYTSGGKYDDFVMHPGDVLYIPRGHAHNASTVSSGGPSDTSIHVTFAIGHDFGLGGQTTSVEALVHFALHDFFLSSPENDSIAIRRKDCPGSEYHIRWGTVLHLYLSTISRVGEGCNDGTGVCALFRRSVLRRPSLPITGSGDILTDSLDDMYIEAIHAYTHILNRSDPVAMLVHFISRLQNDPDVSSNYRFPAMGPWDKIVCPDMLNNQALRERLPKVLSDFRAFAMKRYEAVREMLRGELEGDIAMKVEQDETALAKIRKP